MPSCVPPHAGYGEKSISRVKEKKPAFIRGACHLPIKQLSINISEIYQFLSIINLIILSKAHLKNSHRR